ncbi:MAG: hypothetical protein IPM21_07860 [Acidobacteria bacterium]|nr:hypothetical protein [Acidobacteriota bacterium]
MAAGKERNSYFFVMYTAMLCIVLLAFAPTFYLRSSFPQPEVLQMPRLPAGFYVHGIILTAWYIFLVFQSGLIKFGKTKLHQKTGWVGLALSVGVLVSTIYIVLQFPGRMQALAFQLGKSVDDIEPGLAMILWMDIFMGILFVSFISIGILKRRKPEIHKRVMLYAGIVFIFAATARLSGIVSFLVEADIGLIINNLILFALTASLLAYDKFTQERVTRTTWACFASYWAAMILSILIGNSEIGKAIVI